MANSVLLHRDNMAALACNNEFQYYGRIKHIHIKYNLIHGAKKKKRTFKFQHIFMSYMDGPLD